MVPSQAVFERAFILLGGDSLSFGPSTSAKNLLVLFQDMGPPGPGLILADCTEATFTGYAARACATPSPQSIDPETGDDILSTPNDATGFLWETTNATNLPQTIVGYGIVDSTKTTLLCSASLDNPVTLTAANQSVSIPIPNLRLPAGSIL